jgi:hypothetical protein
MTDQQTMLQAVSNAQRILEEYLEPGPHDNERLLNRLAQVRAFPVGFAGAGFWGAAMGTNG